VPNAIAAADFIPVGRGKHRLDMFEEFAERSIEIQNQRLHFQRMMKFVGKAMLPPEKRVLIELVPEARGDHKIDAPP
jgi:hypothetical protein